MSEIRTSSYKLTFLKPEQSMRDEIKKLMHQKNTMLDREFQCYQSILKHGVVKDPIESELNFKKELDAIVKENQVKAQQLKKIKNNHTLFLKNQESPPKKISDNQIKVVQGMQQAKSTTEDNIKRSQFHQTVSDMQFNKKNIVGQEIQQIQNLAHENNEEIHQIQAIHKDQQQIDTLKINIQHISEQIAKVEEEAIYENSTNDQFKYKAKKYQTLITAIRKKISEQRNLIQMADNRYQNLTEYDNLSKQQMTLALSNLHEQRDQFKILKETEDETLQYKQNIHDMGKQDLMIAKKKTCELLMKVDYLKLQEKNQQSTIENLDYKKIFLYEQKQLSSYIEQNIDTLSKLSEIFVEKKYYLIDDGVNGSDSCTAIISPVQPKKRSSNIATFFNNCDDLESPTSRSGSSISPRLKQMNSIKQTKKELILIKQSSMQSERTRKVDKINKFCESDPEQLINNLIKVYQQLLFSSQSLQSQFEYLQKQKIQLNLSSRKLEQIIAGGAENEHQNEEQKDTQELISNKDKDTKERLAIEVDKFEEIKNEQDRILLSVLYFFLSTLKKHKHLIDEVNDKGEIEPSSDCEIDKLEQIDTILEKYQKGFMKKKIFEQFNNRKKYLEKNSLHSSRNHLSILLPKDPNNSKESIEQQRDSFILKEKFFFFKEIHAYFPLTNLELKQTLSYIFPKSFNEDVSDLVFELLSKDILSMFFLNKDDIISIGEKCFNTYEYFKQFNMILTNQEQLDIYAKKAKNQPIPQRQLHGSRRLSQYSPLKNPFYILQKDEQSDKKGKKESKTLSLKLDLQSIKYTSSVTSLVEKDNTPKDSKNSNQLDFDDIFIKKKIMENISPQNSKTSLEHSKISHREEEDENQSDKSSSESVSKSSESENESEIESNKKTFAQKNKLTLKQKTNNSMIRIYDENEELDQEGREQQRKMIKYQEQCILGEFMIMQFQKRSIKNYCAIIKNIVTSSQDIFNYIKDQSSKYEQTAQQIKTTKPELLQFNQKQIQAFIEQAEKTLQFKKQREKVLNDKLQHHIVDKIEDDDDDDENENEEDGYDINQWKKQINSNDNDLSKQKSYNSDMLSPTSSIINNVEKRRMYDSFISEESQVFIKNDNFQQIIKKPIQNGLKNLNKQKIESIQQEDIIKAKELIIQLSGQKKKRNQNQSKSFNQSNSNFKFKKIEQNSNIDNNPASTQQFSLNNNTKSNKQKLKQILNKQNQSSLQKLQAFQEQKRTKNNQEKEFIDVQRDIIKKEAAISNNNSAISIQLEGSQMKNNSQILFQNEESWSNKYGADENSFFNAIAANDKKMADLQNEDYFINNLKTFHSDAYFLQKLHIIGKCHNQPLHKQNKSLELPKGLHSTKYFEKMKAHEKEQLNIKSQLIPYNQNTKMKDKQITIDITLNKECSLNNQSSQNREQSLKKEQQQTKDQHLNAEKSQNRESSLNKEQPQNKDISANKDKLMKLNETKKSQGNSQKSIFINSIYSKLPIANKIEDLINDSKRHLDSIRESILLNPSKKATHKISSSVVIKHSEAIEEKEQMIQDKVQSKVNQNLEVMKTKNIKSLQQLKKIFNVDQDLSKQRKQSSENTTINTHFESKKNSASFQSQFTNIASPLVSNSSNNITLNKNIFKKQNYLNQQDYVVNSDNKNLPSLTNISSQFKDIKTPISSKAIQSLQQYQKTSPYEQDIQPKKKQSGLHTKQNHHKKSTSQPIIEQPK